MKEISLKKPTLSVELACKDFIPDNEFHHD